MYRYSYIKHRLREKSNLRKILRKGMIDGNVDFFFIISAGRSGSTLLRKHLQESADVYIPPESEDFIPKLVNLYAENLNNYKDFVEKSLILMEKMDCLKAWGLEKTKVNSLLMSIPITCRKIDKIIFEIYSSQISGKGEAKILIGDKTPLLNDYLQLLNTLFPNGKLIYMIRDGRAVVNSYVQSRNYTFEKAVARWKSSLSNYENKKHLFLKNQYLLKYEDFIASPDLKINEILNFLGQKRLPESEQRVLLDMGDTFLAHHANIKNPINSDSKEKWKTELSEQTILKLDEMLKYELVKYQYEK